MLRPVSFKLVRPRWAQECDKDSPDCSSHEEARAYFVATSGAAI